MSDVKKLYNALLSHGYTSEDLGDENTFTTAMSDANNRKELYDGASANGLDLGDYDEYEKRLTQTSNNTIQATTPEPPKAEEVKPIQVPSAPTLKYGEVEDKEYLTPAETTRKMMAQGVKQRQQVADMTANVQQALDDRGVELDAQARQSSQSFIPRGTAGSVAGYDAGRLYDSEYRDYAAAKEALDNAQKLMDEAVANGKEENNKGLFNGFFKSAKRGVEDLDLNNFTFGLKDASENEALLKALDAADEGNATPSQQALLDAAALQMATQADYGSSVGRGYKAGQAAGEAVPFMIEMAINPLSKVGKGIANRVARHYIKKYLGNEVLEQAAKKGTKYALTRIAPRVAQVAGDLAGSAGMAATTGAVNVTADAFKRMQGDVLYSTAEDGTVKYDGHTEGDDAATAFAKAYANSTLQNYSEMFGGYFAPLSRAAGKGITKGLSKVGLDKINSLLNEVSASDLARVVTDFEQYANWNGTMGEFAEEITGGVLNSIFVGDQTLGEVFDKENLTQTLVDVAFLGGIMSSAKVIDYPIYKYQAQSDIKKAKIPFDKLFGSEDKAVMETAFNDSDARVAGNKLREIINSDDYTEEQKMAAANYAKTIQAYKGAKLMDDKRFADPYIPQEEKNVEEAYDKGRAAETPAEMTDANNMYEIAAIELAKRSFGLQDQEIDSKSKEDVEGIVNQIELMYGGNPLQKAHDIRDTDSETSDLILNYAYAKATRDGVVDVARDRISEESAQAEAIIDYRKNKTDGMIHPATLNTKDANGNDRQVYIVSGNIVTFEDGTINTQESDNDIIIQDAVTGKPEFATAKDILRAEQAIDPEVEKQNVRNTIADTIATEVENKMNNVLPFNVGEAYPIIDSEGVEHSVQIVADNGDGFVMASIDNAEAVAMPKSEIQQLSNEYNMNRAKLASEAQKEAKQSEEMMQEAQNVEPTQEDVAEVAPVERVVPTTKDGNPDFNAMDAEMFVDEYVSRYGEDSAVKIARKNISNARENVAKIDKKIDDITDPNQMEGLYAQRKNAEAQIARYSDILDRLGASEDANETEADQRNRLRNDAGNRIATLFPDGMPNVESVILADIATGNRIRWSDKTTNGAVTSRGLGAELGYTEAERRKRLPLIGKDAMTPEEYAESLRERLDALGVRYDESSLRDAVLSVYQSVDSRKGAWDALENIAKRGAEQEVDTDWESMQQERVYNKAQEIAENTPELPSLETIEEETPITEGEYAEMEAQAQAEEQKDYDAMMVENQPINEAGATPVITLSDEKIEFQNKIQEWLSPENVSWAEGKDLSDSIGKFGNEVEPIAILPEIVRGLFPEVSSLYLYSGKGYLIDHAANHHPELSADEYNKIQEVLDSYDDIKDVSTPKTKKIAFVKMLDKGFAVVAELAEKDGKIMLHKTFFYKDAQGKRVPYKNKPSLLKESSVDGSTTISPAESAAGRHRNISALDVSSESKDTTSEPKSQEVDEKILQEEQKVNVNPTDGQKEAGNYKKGHVVVDGFNITIEQPKGSVRSGVDADGKEWSITMNNTYGYIRGTEGVDGDHIDVFLSDNLDNWGGEVFVVDQINTDGSFDEHKVMYGFNSIEEAQQAYLSNYSEGWQGLGAITGVSKDEFKKWIESSHRKTKPFAEYKSVKATEGQSAESVETPEDEENLAEDVTAIESNVDEKPVNKPKSDKKIEDFGEKIGGARKDVARARLLDTVKLSAKDLESLKDPDKILSRKAIIKYMEEGQMTENDGISLLALNMATRGKYRKALTMEKYREVALQWERGEDIDVGITEQDIDKYMANMPEAARVKPNARERAISDLERIILTPYNDYRDTYIALNYPAEYRNLRGTYIYKTAWNDKVVVVSGIDSRRGFVFNTYEQAVAKIKRDFPIVEFEKSKEKSAAKDNKDSEGHLNITKDDMGWYRIKSRSIPGNIYLSGRFRTKKDAEAYLEQNKEVLLEREQKMTESLMGSNIGMVEREGVDYRNGQDVTPEDFLNTFGFRGVEFGNWVPQAERQLYLNKTYDAIMDFCNIIGISPKAFSLGGELALAFGARGKSRALAHYEPLKMVINLTRMKGAGSLAHEWFHAFDNYISKRKTGNISDMATARFAAERDEVSRAFYDLVSKMNSMDYTKRSKRAGEYWGEVEERAARLLENYIYNELERKSQVSPLLVRKDTLFNEEEIPEEDYVKSAWPYPSARENKEIKPYFDHLFSTLEEKVDEQGNVILFRSSAPTYDDHEIRFAELQSEYDALDKNDEQALNAWRDKKAEVVRSFMEGKTEELNLPTKNFRIVKNEEELRSLYNDYSSAMNKWMQDTNKDFVSIDSFNKFKERLSKAQALYSPVMDVIACDINSFPNDEAMAFTVLFHEQTHSVIDKVFKQKQLKDIWDEALVNDAKNANDISATYGDDVYENGNEYLAFILERFTFANFRNRLESFIKGDEAVLVDDLMKNAKETLPLRNEAIKKILKFYNDGYRKERGIRTETWNDGLGRGYAEGSREATTESSRGGSQSSRERRRSEVVEAATDLASSLGVKMTIIEDLNEINDSNPKMRKSKRGSKAWYNITTDEVVFVAPNATSVSDAMQSVWHEVVAHKGLRDVVGREKFDAFLMKVFNAADTNTRSKIVALAAKNGWDFNLATEEYLASLAEEGFDSRENRTFWQKVRDFFMDMLREAKIVIGYNITDNDMRYMLWRTYQKQKSQGAMAVAEDVLMQQKLGVGNFRTRPAGTRQMTEEEQIIADAKANGTYLKAPNGKKSNLTPKQWAQVRTKAFKKWFGDWEKAARIEKLRKSKDAEITGNEIEASEDLKQYKKNAQMYGRTLQGEYTNTDTGAVISLQRGRHNGGINEVLQHNYKDVAHLQSVAAIPQIIENGIYIESQPNKDTDTNPDVKEYQIFVCGLKIGGEDYTVLAKVAVDNKGNRYYDHNLVSVEKGKLIDIANNEQSAISSGFGTTPDTKSTTNSQRKYKELISLLQTNSSKIVDANGEPKVVYNGSKVQHYLYDGRLRTKGQSATNSKVSFFTDNKDVAERYGKFINEVFLNIRNPYEIDYNGAGWQGWSGAADGMQRASTDSYADLLANGSVDSTLERIIENYGRAEADYLASGSVRNKGVAPDGVIAYNVADPIRSTLYIVRNAEAKDISRNSVTPKGVETFTELGKASLLFDSQIKSATDNVGTFDANNDDIRFRTAPNPADIEDGEVKGESKEISKEDKMQNAIRELRKIVKSTKAFRKSLATIIASNLKEIVTDDVINVMGKSEFNALVKQVQEANIQQDAVKPLERIEEIISDLRIKDKEQRINKLLSMKVQGETKSGVSVAQSVDDATRELFTYLKDNINRPIDEIRRSLEGQENHILANLVADIASPYQEATALKRDVLDIDEEIKALKDVNTNLRELLKDADDQKAKQLKQTIKNNKEKVSALETERLHIKAQIEQQLDFVYNTLFDAMQEGRGLYKTFVYENMLRKSEMVDMAIKDIDTGETLSVLLNPPTRWKAAKDKVADLLLSPANSLNHLLKKITINAPNGEGDMYDYFIRGKNGYVAASEKFYNGYNEFKEELNKKAKSVFGKPYIKVLADSNNLSNVTITVTTNDRKQDVPLTLGQAMYVYMVNKMPDGKVKLTNMGIFDEDVEKLRNSLPAEYIVFADWLQNKFLPKRRKEYNETHLEIFGTQMASIENYVPLRNKKDEIYKEVDGTQQEDFALPTTITGSIINRRRNNVILDLTTNALDLMLSHGQEMEHWNAYTPVVKDMNALLSSTKFRLMLENRRRGWWNDMDNAAKIAAGQYNPKTDKLNEAWAVISKGAIASKISFRIWTAMKQVLSFPAFMAYSTSARFYGALAKNIATPYNAWVWGMQNLPILNKRWSERSLGNEKLSQVTRGVFGKILDESAKKGMMPNAFVDALTCAIGAKAVYDYKVKEYEAQMYNKDEAEYRAKIDATLAFNESQQSAEGLFLSQLQSNRDGLSTAFATFNNQNYGYLRKSIEAFLELRRKRDKEVAYLQDRYIQQGIMPDDAERLARSKVKEIKKTAVLSAAMYGFILNLIWELGSNVFKYAFSDDEDEVMKDALKSLLVAPVRNTTIGSMVQSVVQGYDVNPSVLISDINAMIDRSSTTNVTRWDRTKAYLTLKLVASIAVGVDMDTLVRLYEGIEGMINDGVDVEDIMAIINAPRSQALMAARPPKEDESVKEYIERMDKIDRKIDSRISDSMRKTWINNYYMYQLANKNELNVSRDDFGKVSIIEYKQLIDEMKKTKEREKEYEEKGIPQSDLDAFAQQPEYKRMEIVDEHQKEINKSLKKLKTELSDSDRAKEEQNLYNEMRSLLKKVKPLGLSNK